VITRRRISLVGGFSLITSSSLGFGQTGRPLRRVGAMTTSSEALAAPFLAALKQGMRERGWQEGKDVEYRFVYANGAADQYDTMVAELLAQQVDVILVTSTSAAKAAQRATQSVPIVMTSVSGAVATGIVTSLARPGGNVTGLSTQFEDVLPKVIETLHAIVPGAQRVAILLHKTARSSQQLWTVAQTARYALGLDAIREVAGSPAEFSRAAAQIVQRKAQAVVVSADAVFVAERAKLQEAMASTRLPVAHGWREHVVLGGLFSYGVSLAGSLHQVAAYVDRILKGAKPADLPVEQPTKFELVINLRTANALGLTLPPSVLLRADEVIH
jgi:putative ABC transport system substrate-binding protein